LVFDIFDFFFEKIDFPKKSMIFLIFFWRGRSRNFFFQFQKPKSDFIFLFKTRKNVADMISDLEKQFPGMRERLCDSDGSIRKFINVYINEEDIRFLNGIETEIKENDTVSIIPAIAGGI